MTNNNAQQSNNDIMPCRGRPRCSVLTFVSRISIVLLLLYASCISALGQSFDITANGKHVFCAFQNSFPDKVSEVAFTDDDWTITVGGKIFFWAEGRILSEVERKKAALFEAHIFYHYPAKVRSPDTFTPQCIEEIRNMANPKKRLNTKNYSYSLHGVLYNGSSLTEVRKMLETVEFLGKRINVHRMIAEPLKNVEADIRNWEGAEAFIASLDSVHGFNWRQIEGTRRMSYHSWGIAVDLQPKKLNEQAIFWQWEWHRNK
ncbi:MAG: hypothetical protein FWE49_06245, partial [Synergistaceae bacterium]|nr:hypothetical protein [Synergistaceae bacterium]